MKARPVKLEIFARYKIVVPEAVEAHLHSAECKTPLASDPLLSASDMYVLATPQKSLEAAAEIARKACYNPVILGDALEGESGHWPPGWHKKPLPAR